MMGILKLQPDSAELQFVEYNLFSCPLFGLFREDASLFFSIRLFPAFTTCICPVSSDFLTCGSNLPPFLLFIVR